MATNCGIPEVSAAWARREGLACTSPLNTAMPRPLRRATRAASRAATALPAAGEASDSAHHRARPRSLHHSPAPVAATTPPMVPGIGIADTARAAPSGPTRQRLRRLCREGEAETAKRLPARSEEKDSPQAANARSGGLGPSPGCNSAARPRDELRACSACSPGRPPKRAGWLAVRGCWWGGSDGPPSAARSAGEGATPALATSVCGSMSPAEVLAWWRWASGGWGGAPASELERARGAAIWPAGVMLAAPKELGASAEVPALWLLPCCLRSSAALLMGADMD